MLVRMWLDVLVMMLLFWKHAKLNIFLMCVSKSKTTIKMKRNESIFKTLEIVTLSLYVIYTLIR